MIGKVGLKTAENPGFVDDFWAFVTKKHPLLTVSITMYFLINFSTLFLVKNIFFHNILKLPKLRLEISGKFGT